MPARARSTGFSSPLILSVLLLASSVAAQTKVWTTTPDFNTGTLNNASDTKFANEVVLGPTPVSQTHIVWSDNFNYGLIVRLDSITGKQTSRFDSVLNTINGVSTGVRPANEFCNWSNTGNCPGRVAVDTNGDVWIVNRAFGNQGSLSKFSGNIAHCIDRNNNGKIDTSSDLNGDGIIDMNPAHGEYFGQNDECILTTIPVGANNAWPRAVAVDQRGKIWVGTFNEGKIYRFNPEAPVSLELTVNVGGNPYSMASGGNYVFVSNASGQTARVQIQTGAIDYAPCPGNYGIVADPGGQVAWLGSFMTGATGMYRADFTNHTCTLMNSGPGYTTAMTLDNEPASAGGPYVWGANYAQEKVTKWTPAGVYVNSYPAGGTGNAHGLSPDFQGNLWVVSDSANASRQVSQLNPATGAINFSAFIGFLAADVPTYPQNCSTGYCDGATPYLYSDFTGVQIDRIAPYTYIGTFDAVYDGGAQGIPWSKVTWNTEAQGAVPAETSLVVGVRAANSAAGLATAPFVAATSGAALANVIGEFVEVNVALNGPGFVTPVLSDISVVGPCPVIGNACCLENSNCNDGNPCHVGTCPQPGGVCKFTQSPNCCLVNGDCNDNNGCTVDSCPSAGGMCSFAPIAGCCNSNADCSDNDLCTVDVCSGPGGACSHIPINGCCLTNVDCTKGNVCSNATCPTPGGFCVGGPIPGCCQQNSDCQTTDLCAPATCNLATSTCVTTPIPGCCNTDAQCATGNACSKDTCSGAGGMCVHVPIPGCCSPTDPNVGMPCDVPVSPYDKPPCQAGKFACTNGTLTCVGAVQPSFNVCSGSSDNDCDGLVDQPNPNNKPPLCAGTDACIDGVCVGLCGSGEFPCPTGFTCVGNYCMPTDCSKIHCPAGQVCIPGSGTCVSGDGGAGSSTSSSSSSTSSTSSGAGGAGGATASSSSSGSSSSGATGSSSGGTDKYGLATGGACQCDVVGGSGDARGRWLVAALGLMVAVTRSRPRRRREELA
jgi:streptogramin lyase